MSRIIPLFLCASIIFVGSAFAQEQAEHKNHDKDAKTSAHAKHDKAGEKADHAMGDMGAMGMHAKHHGPEADQAAARATVDALFDAMRAADGAAVKAVFADNARLMSTGDRDGVPFVREMQVAGFAEAVDKAEVGSWDERIWDVMIHVNGNLATAWTPYAFYQDGTFSHCGVNAFQIAKMEGGWKILQLTDTRQVDGCDVPAKDVKEEAEKM